MPYILCKKPIAHSSFNYPVCLISKQYFNFNTSTMKVFELKPGYYAHIWYDPKNQLVDIEPLRPKDQDENAYKIQSTFRLRNTALIINEKFTLKLEDILGYYRLYKVDGSCRITLDLSKKI